MLDMDVDKICFIIVKAREFEVQEEVTDGDEGSGMADEDFRGVLAQRADDPVFEELKGWIQGLNWDEQCRLVALAWLGRGDYAVEEWNDAVTTATQRHNEHTAEYLLGMPLLSEYLEEGLSQFGLDCADFELDHF